MNEEEKILLRIKSSIKKDEPNAEIYLYGSRARGDNSGASDWDILVLVDNREKTFETEDKLRNKLYEIELETGQIISTLVYSKDYWKDKLKYSPLYMNVNKEGIHL